MHYAKQQLLPPTPPASPPTKHVLPSPSPTLLPRAHVHLIQLPKGLKKKKGKKRHPIRTEDDQIRGDGETPTTASGQKTTSRSPPTPTIPCCIPTLTPPCDLDISDLCLDAPPSPALCTIIRALMVQDLLAAGRAVRPCRELNILLPSLPPFEDEPCKRRGKHARNRPCGNASCSRLTATGPPSPTITRKDLYRAELEKRNLLGPYVDSQVPRLGTEHTTCSIGKCGIKRCLMWDSLMDGGVRDVMVKIHIQPSLVKELALPPFTMSFKLHVHEDDITGSSFVCASELVRAILPRFFGCFEKRMHSLYTLNHPFGRGTPFATGEDEDGVLDPDVWKKWAGCPQALQRRKCDPSESKTRIWLLEDGTAEVSIGAECEPDECTIAPPINSLKGKSRAC